MISLEQISGEIAALEAEKPTFVTMQKLASLYIVRDHMVIGVKQTAEPAPVSVSVSDILPDMGDSEFYQAIAGKNASDVWEIVNETMDTLKIMEPRLYAGVIRKIQQ